MGFIEGDFPPVDQETFLDEPLMDRVKALALHWCEYGFGTPKVLHVVYILKLVVLYIGGGIAVATFTSDVGGYFSFGEWWNEPIVYQKFILWTVMLEAMGLGGSWGPLAGKFKPMTGGILFWARPGTLRMSPWPQVPLTGGDQRTIGDVILYLGFLASIVWALVLPGVSTSALDAVSADNAGLVRPAVLGLVIALWLAVGLRDKVIFLGTRAEQYLPPVILFATLAYTDMIIGLKLVMVIVWIGAGISKIGHHFSNVVGPMMSNSPMNPFIGLRRAQYRDFPNDVRPSKVSSRLAHYGGTSVEILTPLVLLFSTNTTVTLLAVALMVCFHMFILSAFPLAVPLSWNVMFAFGTVFLFWGHQASDGFAITDMSSPALTALIVAALVFFPILGNLRPDLVSFLPSMRPYAGNWASALWAFKPGAEAKLDALTRPAKNQVIQLQEMVGGVEPDIAEITMQQTIGWRSLHSQGRGLFSILLARLPDIEERTVREAEFACNSIMGFNFGDGHFHNARMIEAVQKRCNFAPGEFMVAWVESQPIHKPTQEYQLIDAALGVVERGTWDVKTAVNTQPWLPDGPIPLNVTWRAEGIDLTDGVDLTNLSTTADSSSEVTS